MNKRIVILSLLVLSACERPEPQYEFNLVSCKPGIERPLMPWPYHSSAQGMIISSPSGLAVQGIRECEDAVQFNKVGISTYPDCYRMQRRMEAEQEVLPTNERRSMVCIPVRQVR